MYKTAAAVLSVLIFPALAFSGSFELGSYSAGDLPQVPYVQPHGPAPVTPPGVTIADYTTEEEFSFESEAEEALNARVAALRAAGVTTLGGRVTERGNDYTFVIEYLPAVKGNAALPPAVLVETYKNGEAYWLTKEAEEAMRAAAANFRAARLAVLGSYLYDAGNDDAFAVDYVVKNLLRPSQEYAVKFGKYAGGKFNFESEAEEAVPSYLALFKRAGLPAIRGRAVRRPDGDYSVEVEYAVKTNASGRRPQYSVVRYDARETFAFDKEAAKAGRAALPAFAAAGLPPLSSVVRPSGGDYSYAVDFLVGNIYQQGGVVPSAAVQTYQAPETFTFEREAEEALAAKAAAFNAAGLPVIGSAVTGSLGSYTYVLDYAVKAGQNGPAQQPL
ncbi:MAG: hypothetical protein AB7V08_08955 [Elusimicrobiales bacterium]